MSLIAKRMTKEDLERREAEMAELQRENAAKHEQMIRDFNARRAAMSQEERDAEDKARRDSWIGYNGN